MRISVMSHQLSALAALGALALAACGESPVETTSAEIELAKGGKGKGGQFAITAFSVEPFVNTETHGLTDDPAIDDELESRTGIPSAWFGCPVTGSEQELCNRVVMEFEGSIDSIQFRVGHDVRGLYYSSTVENAFRALGWTHAFMPMIPVDRGSGRVTVYWQGQRRHSIGWPVTHEWDKMPDLDPLGSLNSFAFRYAYKTGPNATMGGSTTRAFPDGAASYRGRSTELRAYPVLDDLTVMRREGRGKKNPDRTWVRIEAKAFTDTDHTVAANVAADFTLLITRPDGSQYIPGVLSTGIDPDNDPDLYKQEVDTEYLVEGGCHEVELIGVYGLARNDPNYEGRDVVWDPGVTGASAGPVAIHYDAATDVVTFDLTGGC